MSGEQNERVFELVNELKESAKPGDTGLESRMVGYELAFKMRTHAVEAVDLSNETKETMALDGLNRNKSTALGTRLLLARRLVERGVRFVQVYSGGGPRTMQWDAPDDIDGDHEMMCAHADKPIADLLTDLKRTGLLKDTLMVWCSEFGRTPNCQGSVGRDHNPLGYTMWLAGGGSKGGVTVGSTDEFGMDHERLTIPHSGCDERLTDVGAVVKAAVSE